MVYIYEEGEEIRYQRDIVPAGNFIAIERMIPIPVVQNYRAVLRANFESKEVWFDLIELTLTLDEVRRLKIEDISEYDKSDAVNGFMLDGRNVWLDRDTRASVINSIGLEKAAGKETTFRWLGGAPYTLPVDTALEMLAAVEMYATETYNVTQAHIAAVNLLDDIEAVMEYDYRVGYPEQLVFNL